jgi:hypothetical protein
VCFNLGTLRWIDSSFRSIFASLGSSSWTLSRCRLPIERRLRGTSLLCLAITVQAAFIQISANRYNAIRFRNE